MLSFAVTLYSLGIDLTRAKGKEEMTAVHTEKLGSVGPVSDGDAPTAAWKLSMLIS